ncbi:beta-lactamase family protein [Massilia sp. H-1]|nr:beta-lactamase family protein [Massilia sp. H-1]
MSLATFGDSYDLVPNAATIYAFAARGTSASDDGKRLSHWFYGIPYGLWAGGSVQTSADDVARWLIALAEGRLISQASLRRMWTPEKLNDGTNGDWGSGWPVLQSTPERQVAGIGGTRGFYRVSGSAPGRHRPDQSGGCQSATIHSENCRILQILACRTSGR